MHDKNDEMPEPFVPQPVDGALYTEATSQLIGYRLRRAQLFVFQRFHAVFEQMELRPAEYTVMVMIEDNPGRRQIDIADVLGIKKANFVTLANGLEARGLIERRRGAPDKRARTLYLTHEGKAVLIRARALHDAMENDIVDQLGGPEARDTLLSLLDRLG